MYTQKVFTSTKFCHFATGWNLFIMSAYFTLFLLYAIMQHKPNNISREGISFHIRYASFCKAKIILLGWSCNLSSLGQMTKKVCQILRILFEEENSVDFTQKTKKRHWHICLDLLSSHTWYNFDNSLILSQYLSNIKHNIGYVRWIDCWQPSHSRSVNYVFVKFNCGNPINKSHGSL